MRKDKRNSEDQCWERSGTGYGDGEMCVTRAHTPSQNLTCCSCPWKKAWLVEVAGRADHHWRRLLVPGWDRLACLRVTLQCCSYPRRQKQMKV